MKFSEVAFRQFPFVRLFIHSSSQILLPQYLVNGLNDFYKTDREYSISHTDDLIIFWRSKVKVTPWFKCMVAKAYTLTLER